MGVGKSLKRDTKKEIKRKVRRVKRGRENWLRKWGRSVCESRKRKKWRVGGGGGGVKKEQEGIDMSRPDVGKNGWGCFSVDGKTFSRYISILRRSSHICCISSAKPDEYNRSVFQYRKCPLDTGTGFIYEFSPNNQFNYILKLDFFLFLYLILS